MIEIGAAVTLDLKGYNREMDRLRFFMKSSDKEFYTNLFKDGWAHSMGIVLETRKHAKGEMGYRILWSMSGGDTVRLWHKEHELCIIGEE